MSTSLSASFGIDSRKPGRERSLPRSAAKRTKVRDAQAGSGTGCSSSVNRSSTDADGGRRALDVRSEEERSMTYMAKPLSGDPTKLRGLSEKLMLSHWENNYGGAV